MTYEEIRPEKVKKGPTKLKEKKLLGLFLNMNKVPSAHEDLNMSLI
jgi:hypothetical protein